MKTREVTAFKEMQSQFWRAQLRESKTPEQALATLEKEAGMDRGRAIMQMRSFRPDLYNEWCVKPQKFQPVKNPGMENFNFIGR